MEKSNNGKELKVSAIKEGTVLDHIPANQLFRVIDILHLSKCDNQMTFGTNLECKKKKKKAIVKIAGRYFKDDEINKISLVAPQAKINIIKNFEVTEKRVIEVPKEITGMVKCMNPKCITNHQPITTKFEVRNLNGSLKLHCHYCEKDTDTENLIIISKN